MRKVFKVVGGLLLVIVVVAVGAYAWAATVANGKYGKRWTLHDATFPIPWPLADAAIDTLKRERIAAGASAKDPLAGVDLQAVALERAVSRGDHLVNSRVGCTGCHGSDFGGSVVIDVPVVGYWAAPNLTSGEGSVTRTFTSRDWDGAVRHGVRQDGRTSSMPCGDYANLSDRELSDIVAYIQGQPPVKRDVGAVKLGPVFTFLIATDPKMLSPFSLDHQKPHAAEPPPDEPTAVLGEHIVQVCRTCHGPNLSGGKLAGDPNMPIVANITPDASGLKGWTEADFVRAMREGTRPNGTAILPAMPWGLYGKMSDIELAAVWAYLQTVAPAPKGSR